MCFGFTRDGQLDLGDSNDRYVPMLIPTIRSATAVVAGYEHSLVLLSNGPVMGFAFNGDGQLGLGDSNDHYAPTLSPAIRNATEIAAACYHSLVRLSNASTMSLGAGLGDDVQSGVGDTTVPSVLMLYWLRCWKGCSLSIHMNRYRLCKRYLLFQLHPLSHTDAHTHTYTYT